MCGVPFKAILTGLTFVRFSRPRPRLLFAPNPVVAMRNGKPTLMVRLGYGRAGTLFDATARLAILLSGKTPAGHLFRRVQEVPLQRAQLPVLPFTWTLMHALDERSPLYGFDAARAIAAQARVFVIFQARDPTLATWVHDIHDYAAQDIRFGLRYADVVTEAADGTPIADMRKIGMLEADQGEAFEEISWTESEGLEDSSSQPGSDIP